MSQAIYPVLRGDEDIDWQTGEIFKVCCEQDALAGSVRRVHNPAHSIHTGEEK